MPVELVFARQERPVGLSTLEQVRALKDEAEAAASTAATNAVTAAGPAIAEAVQDAAGQAATDAAEQAAAAVAPAAAEAIRAQVAADADRAEAAAGTAATEAATLAAQQAAEEVAPIAAAAVRAEVQADAQTAQTAAGTATTEANRATLAANAAGINANVYTDVATGRAAVADGVEFQVLVGDEYVRYRRTNATTQAEVGRFPSTARVDAIRMQIPEPFPNYLYEQPVSLFQISSPTATGITTTHDSFQIAAGGRFYSILPLDMLGFAGGDTVKVAFRQLDGSGRPLSLTWRDATNVVLATLTFQIVGGWYAAEAVVPATTNRAQIDWTNGTGAPVTISRPRFAKRVSHRDGPVPSRVALDNLASDPGTLPNLWAGAASVGRIAGTGSDASVVIHSDGRVTVPADYMAAIRPPFDTITRVNGTTMTALCRVTGGVLISMNLRFVGASTGTQTVPMKPVGDGWWAVTATVNTTDPVGIAEVYFEPDNRNKAGQGYTTAPITLSDMIVLDGSSYPMRKPAPATGSYPDDEIVLTQAVGLLQIAHRAGEPGKYARWSFARYNDPATRALGWRVTGLETAIRAGDTAFSGGLVLTDTGEVEVAIRERGKSDFMGGATHGDMQEARSLLLLVDGAPVTPDGATTYRARRIEAIQEAQMWEVDNATNTLTATIVTRWVWEKGEFRLSNWLRWERSITVETCYLAMLPLLRHVGGGTSGTLITGTMRPSPRFAPYSVSDATYAGDAPRLNAARNIFTGDAGVGVSIEVVKGWTADAQSFPFGLSNRNKIYFLPFESNATTGTQVTAGDVIDWESVYKIGVSA